MVEANATIRKEEEQTEVVVKVDGRTEDLIIESMSIVQALHSTLAEKNQVAGRAFEFVLADFLAGLIGEETDYVGTGKSKSNTLA